MFIFCPTAECILLILLNVIHKYVATFLVFFFLLQSLKLWFCDLACGLWVSEDKDNRLL